MPQTRIGISGWTYGPWRGTFYPKDLPHRRELEFASAAFNSIEINGSFYRMQRPTSFLGWYAKTPADFVFSVKGGQYITHMRRLRDVQTPLANFFASGVLALREKLGPILWQFPPQFALDMERFETFFAMLPHDTDAAALLAQRHDARLPDAYTEVDDPRVVRHVVEVRHPSFMCEPFIRLLRQHNIALVFADSAGLWPYTEDVTADFIYARLHGASQIYTSGYTDSELDWWAKRLNAWRSGREPPDARRIGRPARKARGRDIYVYFDNDVKVQAPVDAKRLAELLRQRPREATGKKHERAQTPE